MLDSAENSQASPDRKSGRKLDGHPPLYFLPHSGNNNSSSLVTSISLAYQTEVPRPNARSKQTISTGEGKDMKKLLITGIALCFMGLAVPSFAAARQDQTQQDQTQQDQMKKDDGMKHDDMSKDNMAKDSKSKKKMKKDNMKHDGMKHDEMKHDDMSKDAPKN
jgi:pentapeptide MXKDX repeat protein